MKNNKGFTLIELLAVIVILAIITVLATTSILPYFSSAREDSFRIEASNAVKSAKTLMNAYDLGQFKFDTTGTGSCKNSSVACITIARLIEANLYDGDASTLAGKVVIDLTQSQEAERYTLFFRKGNEYYITNGRLISYVDKENEHPLDEAWDTDQEAEYTSCTCQ